MVELIRDILKCLRSSDSCPPLIPAMEGPLASGSKGPTGSELFEKGSSIGMNWDRNSCERKEAAQRKTQVSSKSFKREVLGFFLNQSSWVHVHSGSAPNETLLMESAHLRKYNWIHGRRGRLSLKEKSQCLSPRCCKIGHILNSMENPICLSKIFIYCVIHVKYLLGIFLCCLSLSGVGIFLLTNWTTGTLNSVGRGRKSQIAGEACFLLNLNF